MIDIQLIIIVAVVYIVGTACGFFIGRKMGINIGSELTFDLFVRLGYVKSNINERGEIEIERVSEGREPY